MLEGQIRHHASAYGASCVTSDGSMKNLWTRITSYNVCYTKLLRKPMPVPRLASEVWQAIKGEDWVLTAGDLGGWGKKLWSFDRPYCHGGRHGARRLPCRRGRRGAGATVRRQPQPPCARRFPDTRSP